MACGKTAGEQGGEKGGEAVKSVDVAVTFSVSSLEKSSRARNRETFVSLPSPLFLSLSRERNRLRVLLKWRFAKKKSNERM